MLFCEQIVRGGIMPTFQERFNELKDERNVSVQEVAEFIGMSKSNLTRIVNGSVKLKMEILVQLSKYFDVDEEYLSGKSNTRHSINIPSEWVAVLEKAYKKGVTATMVESFVDYCDRIIEEHEKNDKKDKQ